MQFICLRPGQKVRVALEKIKKMNVRFRKQNMRRQQLRVFQLTDYKSREENYYSSMLAKADIAKRNHQIYRRDSRCKFLHQEEENIL